MVKCLLLARLFFFLGNEAKGTSNEIGASPALGQCWERKGGVHQPWASATQAAQTPLLLPTSGEDFIVFLIAVTV